MILKILADTWQIVKGLYARSSQFVRRANAREQQHLARVNRSAREDHLAIYTGFRHNAVAKVGNAQRASFFDEQSRNVRAGQNGKILAMKPRPQVSVSSALALAILLRHLI